VDHKKQRAEASASARMPDHPVDTIIESSRVHHIIAVVDKAL
jgi:hypothetical protein